MKGFFKYSKKLEHRHLLEIAGLCAAAMLLVFAAVFVGSGGMGRINHLLATNHITSVSQTGSVFPSNNTSYSLVGLYNLQNNVYPGTSVTWVWNAGTYGANTFSQVCFGSDNGNYECQVQPNSPPSFPLSGSSGNVDLDRYSCQNGGYCNGFGASGGSTPVGSGYPGGYVILTAPATGGTYTYYFCSYWIEHKYGSAAGCASNSLTVVDPCPAASFGSPWNSTSYLIYSGGVGSIVSGVLTAPFPDDHDRRE
jgi:hypothetical protein